MSKIASLLSVGWRRRELHAFPVDNNAVDDVFDGQITRRTLPMDSDLVLDACNSPIGLLLVSHRPRAVLCINVASGETTIMHALDAFMATAIGCVPGAGTMFAVVVGSRSGVS